MRITTVRWTSRLTISHLFSLGCIKIISRSYGVTSIVALLIAFAGVQHVTAQTVTAEDKKREQQELEARVKNTLKQNGESIQFLENRGQIPNKDVLYYFEGANGAVYIEPGRIRFVAIKDSIVEEVEEEHGELEEDDLYEEEESRIVTATHTFSLYLKEAKLNPTLRLGESFSTKYNYFIGDDARQWTSGVRAAKELTLEDLYPGIGSWIQELISAK
jgi:hypothetical protein